MSAACRMTRRAPACVRAAMMASILAGATARADDVPAYCGELRQVASAALTKDKFAGIIGKPRAGNYLDTRLPCRAGRTARSMARAPTPAIPPPSEPQRKVTARSRTSSVKSKPAFATAGPTIKAGHPRDMSCCATTARWPRSPSTRTGRRKANTSFASSCFCEAGRVPRGRYAQTRLTKKTLENCLTNVVRCYFFIPWGMRSPHEASCRRIASRSSARTQHAVHFQQFFGALLLDRSGARGGRSRDHSAPIAGSTPQDCFSRHGRPISLSSPLVLFASWGEAVACSSKGRP
jgi:hypothetical protein